MIIKYMRLLFKDLYSLNVDVLAVFELGITSEIFLFYAYFGID